MERGPVPAVAITRDAHLYDIYVSAAPATESYAAGMLSIYLRREYPDYMHVRLATDQSKDGRVHARVAISPEMESKYLLYVYDQQPNGGKQLLLLSEKLTHFGKSPSP